MQQLTEPVGTARAGSNSNHTVASMEPTWVWGLPLSPVTADEALAAIAAQIEGRMPSVCITANLNYAMHSARSEVLRRLNERAFLILADGMPLVWASRGGTRPLPERVAG